MRRLTLLFLLAIAACNDNKPAKNYNKHDTVSIIKHDTVTIIKEPETTAIISKNADPVALIRQQVEHINTTKLTTKHVEFICDEKTTVDYFYENTTPVKISIDYGWVGDAHAIEDYYFNKGKLIFFYEFVEGGPACEGCIKTNEYRSYIDGDKVFKYLKNKDEAKCRRCEFGPLSKPYQLLTTSTADEAKKVLCK